LKRFSRRYQLMNIDKFYSDSTASLYSLDFWCTYPISQSC
jgi:hypothetical protein